MHAIAAKHYWKLAQVDSDKESTRHYWHRTPSSRSINVQIVKVKQYRYLMSTSRDETWRYWIRWDLNQTWLSRDCLVQEDSVKVENHTESQQERWSENYKRNEAIKTNDTIIPRMLTLATGLAWSFKSPKYDDTPESTVRSEGLVIWCENGFWFGSRFGVLVMCMTTLHDCMIIIWMNSLHEPKRIHADNPQILYWNSITVLYCIVSCIVSCR
jgi:hypothetical protein